MANPAPHWDDLHRQRRLTPPARSPSDLALTAVELLQRPGHVLELGCGRGRDARYFGERGHAVVATDVSVVALREAMACDNNGRVSYVGADAAQPLPFRQECFDLVYSRLSLHYFTDTVTRQVMSEIRRVLKPGGALVALFRSTEDPLYGKGIRLEKDLYVLDGRARRFLDPAYVTEVTGEWFDIADLSQSDGDAFGAPSSFTRLIARKR